MYIQQHRTRPFQGRPDLQLRIHAAGHQVYPHVRYACRPPRAVSHADAADTRCVEERVRLNLLSRRDF